MIYTTAMWQIIKYIERRAGHFRYLCKFGYNLSIATEYRNFQVAAVTFIWTTVFLSFVMLHIVLICSRLLCFFVYCNWAEQD